MVFNRLINWRRCQLWSPICWFWTVTKHWSPIICQRWRRCMRVPRRPLQYRLWARITAGKYLIKMALRVPCSTRLKVWRVRYSWVAQTRTSWQQAKLPNKMTSYSKLPKNCTRVLSSTPSRMSRQLTPVWPWAAIKVLRRLVFLVMPAWV